MNTSPTDQKRKFWGKMIWISAISLVVTICAPILVYVLGMMNAFSTLKKSGAADPAELAGDISTVIFGTLICVPFAFAALSLFIISIIRHRKFSNPSEAG